MATSCTGTPSFLCENSYPGGTPRIIGGVNLRLTQSGTFFHGFLAICGGEDDQMAGTVASNGMLTISSTSGGSVAFSGPMTASLALMIRGTVMTGSFACTQQGSGDTITFTGTVENLTLYSRNPNQNF